MTLHGDLPLYVSPAAARSVSGDANAAAIAAAAAVSAAASKPGSSGSTAAAAATAAINRAEGHGQVGSVGVSTQIVRALQLAARQLRARRAHATRRAAPLVVPASCASSVAMGGAMGGSSYSGSYSGGSLNATAHPPSSLLTPLRCPARIRGAARLETTSS